MTHGTTERERTMDRREFLTSVGAAVALVAAPAGVPCDIMSSSEGDCLRQAVFQYADPAINRPPRPIGPRNFCEKHLGCASVAVVRIGAER